MRPVLTRPGLRSCTATKLSLGFRKRLSGNIRRKKWRLISGRTRHDWLMLRLVRRAGATREHCNGQVHRSFASLRMACWFHQRREPPADDPPRSYRTTSTSRMESRARKNLMETKSRNRFSIWRLLNTRCSLGDCLSEPGRPGMANFTSCMSSMSLSVT